MIYITIERGTTEYLARILEPGRKPYYFVPSGMYFGVSMVSEGMLRRVLSETLYNHEMQFLSGEEFNSRVDSSMQGEEQ